MIKSIFELERRFDFNKEFCRLIDLLNQYMYNSINRPYKRQEFWTIVNDHFLEWKHRLTAVSVEQYLDDIDVDFNNIKHIDNTQKMYVLQFIESFIMFLIKERKINDYIYLEDAIYKPYVIVMENIEIIIEKLNFKKNINEKENYVFYTKRDADVDSILSIIENEDDLQVALLEYNDFRIENDIRAKRDILKKLGDYLEPFRKELKSYNSSLTDDVFFMLNKLYIRHNNEGNIKFDSDKEYIQWYDELFKMIIHLIRTKYVSQKQSELKKFKV